MLTLRGLKAVLILAVLLVFGGVGFLSFHKNTGTKAAATQAQESWVVRDFEAEYDVRLDSSVNVTESILVDFQGLAHPGIFRYIPLELDYGQPSKNGPHYRRKIVVKIDGIYEGSESVPFTSSRQGANLVLKIDPNCNCRAQVNYRILYTVYGAMTGLANYDDFTWNVTGRNWPVSIQRVDIHLTAPSVQDASCSVDNAGSTTACAGGKTDASHADFSGTQLSAGQGISIDVVTPPGTVAVPPPMLISQETAGHEVGLNLLVLLGVLAGVVAFVFLRHRRSVAKSRGSAGYR